MSQEKQLIDRERELLEREKKILECERDLMNRERTISEIEFRLEKWEYRLRETQDEHNAFSRQSRDENSHFSKRIVHRGFASPQYHPYYSSSHQNGPKYFGSKKPRPKAHHMSSPVYQNSLTPHGGSLRNEYEENVVSNRTKTARSSTSNMTKEEGEIVNGMEADIYAKEMSRPPREKYVSEREEEEPSREL